MLSHQQSLAQCREWLDAKLPGVERVAVASNAEAARLAAKDASVVAIAGSSAAEIYGLKMLASNIEDEPDNTTRFLIIGRFDPLPSGDDKTSLLVSGKNRAGALMSLLAPLARHRINMTRIESRPARRGLWEYVFFVDIDGHMQDPTAAQGDCRAGEGRVIPEVARLLSQGGALTSHGGRICTNACRARCARLCRRLPCPGKPIEELEREYGVTNVIKLASNENPLGPSPKALAAAQAALARDRTLSGWRRLRAQARAGREAWRAPEQITLGNGSNDILEFAARAFVTAQDEVVFSQHAFAVYPIVTRAVGARAVEVPSRNWGHDLAAMHAAITARTRLIFIANPNNPTGTWLAPCRA